MPTNKRLCLGVTSFFTKLLNVQEFRMSGFPRPGRGRGGPSVPGSHGVRCFFRGSYCSVDNWICSLAAPADGYWCRRVPRRGEEADVQEAHGVFAWRGWPGGGRVGGREEEDPGKGFSGDQGKIRGRHEQTAGTANGRYSKGLNLKMHPAVLIHGRKMNT